MIVSTLTAEHLRLTAHSEVEVCVKSCKKWYLIVDTNRFSMLLSKKMRNIHIGVL